MVDSLPQGSGAGTPSGGQPAGDGNPAGSSGAASQLPEGISSVDELVEQYNSLRTKSSEIDKVKEEVNAKLEAKIAEQKVDISKYAKEIEATGKLDDNSYKELEGKGFTKTDVDSYVEGQIAKAEKETNYVLSSIGGKEGYTALSEWAKTGLTEEERNKFNSILETKNVEAVKLALESLSSRMVEATGKSPNLFRGSVNMDKDIYSSMDDVVAAIQDKRYNGKTKEDRDYQNSIKEKIARSQHLYKHKL
jgi:vacuolar-type H+-ATPase subunit I/STV1